MVARPLVSIIIPTKNEEDNIVRCLKALKVPRTELASSRGLHRRSRRALVRGGQTYPNIEIILVDNHSTDKTVALAKPFVNKTIVAGPERSEQRNRGAKEAKGSWLLFIDADMESSRGLVSECIEIVNKSRSTPAIVANEEAKGYDFWGRALALERKTYRYSPTFITAARFFPKRDFIKTGGYDASLVAGEDWDLTQRFKEKGYPILMTQKSYLRHHEAKASLSELINKEIFYIKNMKGYAKKHPETFSYQGSFLYRGFIYARAWRLLIKHPVLTMAFLWYKFVVWVMWKIYK